MLIKTAAATATLALPALSTPQEFKKIRIGMIGTAHSHAAGKLSAVQKKKDLFELVGVCEPDEKRRQSLPQRREYANVPIMTLEQLLNHPGLEAVLVEGAVREKATLALAPAQAGLHIHLEKPGGSSLDQFTQIIRLAKQKEKIVQLGYMFRGNPGFELAFQAAREGWLGDIFEINAVMGKLSGEDERKEMAQFPGGTMFELGCHLIDAVVTLLGKPSKVFPFLKRLKPQDNLADHCTALLEYDKAVATIRSCAVDVEGGARRQFTLCATRGALTIHPLEAPKMTLTLTQDHGDFRKGTQLVELRKMTGRYDDQIARFAKMIRGQLPLDYSHEHEMTVFQTVLAASAMT